MEEISNQIIPIVYCSPGSERDSEITRKRKTVRRMDQKYKPVGQRISSLGAKQVMNAEGTIKKGPESKSTSPIPSREQLVGLVSLFVFATQSIPSLRTRKRTASIDHIGNKIHQYSMEVQRNGPSA